MEEVFNSDKIVSIHIYDKYEMDAEMYFPLCYKKGDKIKIVHRISHLFKYGTYALSDLYLDYQNGSIFKKLLSLTDVVSLINTRNNDTMYFQNNFEVNPENKKIYYKPFAKVNFINGEYKTIVFDTYEQLKTWMKITISDKGISMVKFF